MRSLLVALLLGGLGGAALLDCSSFEPAGDGSPDAAPSEGGEPDATVDGARADRDAASADASRCDSGCPGTAGPCGVRLTPTLCIDSTEVTVADYRAFAASVTSSDAGGAPCDTIPILAIGVAPNDSAPMTQVSFCESRAYCQWAGKALCGLVGGGPVPSGQHATQASAWFNACTGGSAGTIKLVTDAGCQIDAGSFADAGTTCQGGVPGLFDMVGNAWEWIDAPFVADAGPPQSLYMGGSYAQSTAKCNDVQNGTIVHRAPTIGFRCCSYE
jgi:formylglycine-generating enzyme